MSIPVHRNGDLRNCGASTVVEGQGTVFVNGQLASVEGDPDTHGAGELTADTNDGTVFVGGKKLVLDGSSALPDNKWKKVSRKKRRQQVIHKDPFVVSNSPNVFAC